MIILNKINLSFGQQVIFRDISCNFEKKSRIALVGRNGSGKSTFLKVLAGLEGVDSGEISIEKGAKIGYMPQEVVLQSDKTIYEETFSAFKNIFSLVEELKRFDDLQKTEKDSDNRSYSLVEGDTLGDPKNVERYAQIQHDLLELDAASAETETKKILMGLGFSKERFCDPVSSLSVGWKMRVVLAKLLLQKADYYFFDEPTNHLDIVTKDWFLDFLKNSKMGFMLVCHDRYFLDKLCEKTFELENGYGTLYHGNYTFYVGQKEQKTLIQEKAAARQEKEIAQKMKTVERFRASASKAKMAQSMLKKLEKVERINTSGFSSHVSFSFPPVERSGKIVLKIDNLSFSFKKGGAFAEGDTEIVKNISFEIERGEKVAIVAPNGVGKTTLLNLITGKLQPNRGYIEFGHNVSHSFFEQEQDKILNKENEILQEVEEACKSSETRAMARKMLGSFLFTGDDVKKKIRVLSGGEKNRVAMAKVLLQQANFLILDEPTNHLDIQSKEILLKALKKFNGTILFVSHDRDFLDKLSTRILELSRDKISSYPGNYESYLYTKQTRSSGVEGDTFVEGDTLKRSNTSKKNDAKIDNKKQYELRRSLNKLEGKIDRLEKKIDALNEELESCEYGTEKFSSVYEKLVKTKKDLDESFLLWEDFQKKL